MPRKSKNVHGKPENAGEQNLPKGYAEKNKDSENTMAGIMPIYNKGFENRQNYKGQYDEESLMNEINNFLVYCFENEVKPAKVGLSLWLGINKDTMYAWVRDKNKYGFKSDLIRQAFDAIELSYIGRAEKYPTANLFLLRTSHGHVETSKLDVQTQASEGASADEIKDMVSKLGLDKK